jgi:hypothetical protein
MSPMTSIQSLNSVANEICDHHFLWYGNHVCSYVGKYLHTTELHASSRDISISLLVSIVVITNKAGKVKVIYPIERYLNAALQCGFS